MVQWAWGGKVRIFGTFQCQKGKSGGKVPGGRTICKRHFRTKLLSVKHFENAFNSYEVNTIYLQFFWENNFRNHRICGVIGRGLRKQTAAVVPPAAMGCPRRRLPKFYALRGLSRWDETFVIGWLGGAKMAFLKRRKSSKNIICNLQKPKRWASTQRRWSHSFVSWHAPSPRGRGKAKFGKRKWQRRR